VVAIQYRGRPVPGRPFLGDVKGGAPRRCSANEENTLAGIARQIQAGRGLPTASEGIEEAVVYLASDHAGFNSAAPRSTSKTAAIRCPAGKA